MVLCAIKLYRTDVKYACCCLYSSPVFRGTDERKATGRQPKVGNDKSRRQTCLHYACKEEEDEVKVHEVGRGFILLGKINFINFRQI